MNIHGGGYLTLALLAFVAFFFGAGLGAVLLWAGA